MTYSIQPQSDLEITFHYSHTLLTAFTRLPHYSAQPLSLGSRGPFVSDTSPKCINWEGLGRPRTGIRKSWNHISLTSLLGVVKNVNKMLIKIATNINTGSIYDVYLLAYVCLRRNDSHWRRYRVFSLTWPASMLIYWNKRKRLHKKRVQLPQDWFGTPTWPPFHCFGTPIWSPWRHVKTLYYQTVYSLFPRNCNYTCPSFFSAISWFINCNDLSAFSL